MAEDQNEQFQRTRVALDFAEIGKLITRDLKLQRDYYPILRKYSREDIEMFLDYPQRSERATRDISLQIYNKSNHYKRLVQYFSKMLTLSYIVEPVNIDYEKVNTKTLQNQFKKTLQFLDQMNIKHEFSKILNVAFREDVFFGYEHMDKNSYFFQKLDSDYCEISSIEDGVFNFAFDFTYFQRYPEKLDAYPPEFIAKYNIYQKDGFKRWQELDSSKTICIKINEDIPYLIPPFFAVFESIFDIEYYKDIHRDQAVISNYKVLVQKLPIRKDSDHNNDFMIDFDNMMLFHNKASESLPPQVGLITTPMDVTDISFDKDIAGIDNVERAEREYWNIAGVSSMLFNTDKSSSISLNRSMQNDEAIAFTVLRQIERWINRRLKFFISNINFRINMLNTTVFNEQDFFNNVLSAAQFGIPVKFMVGASLGLSPSSVINMALLENEILNLPEKFVPLASSHTAGQDGSTPNGSKPTDKGGRPQKDDKNISAEALKTRDSNTGSSKGKSK